MEGGRTEEEGGGRTEEEWRREEDKRGEGGGIDRGRERGKSLAQLVVERFNK